DADALVILTDQSGLFTGDPRRDPEACLLDRVVAGDPSLEAMAGGAGSSLGRGGMITKVLAARRAASSGAHTVVASGREADVLIRLARGESIGTRFIAQTPRMAARKQWLADHLQLRGSVRLDAGAASALVAGGRSLLPIGVTEVSGEFERGEAVAIRDPEGREIARGLINYSSSETRLIMRRPSSEIEGILGFVEEPELIHRDNLVIRGKAQNQIAVKANLARSGRLSQRGGRPEPQSEVDQIAAKADLARSGRLSPRSGRPEPQSEVDQIAAKADLARS